MAFQEFIGLPSIFIFEICVTRMEHSVILFSYGATCEKPLDFLRQGYKQKAQ